jgi:hypothetical protein
MKNNAIMKTKNILYSLRLFFLPLALGLAGLACNPVEDDSYSLGGQLPAKPSFDVQVVDNDNEVVITFSPLTITEDPQVEAVHFTAPEAGINFSVKDAETVSYSKKVFRGGSYTLYVAVVNRAGSSEPQEIPFTVTKDLLLETLSESVLTESGTLSGQAFIYADLYIEKSSFITLAGQLAGDDVTLNLDYFKRISTTEAQFLGESGIYTVYYNAAAKVALLGVPAPDYPDYLIATGKNFAYPAKAGSAYYIGGYPENAATTDILQYVLFRKIGDKTFQATVFIKDSDVEFKPYHASGGGKVINGWGNGGEYNYDKCTFSGVSGVLVDGGGEYHNWVAGPRADATQPYRITVSITSDGSEKAANVSIQAVDFNGEIVEIPEEPETPPEEDTPETINFNAFAASSLDNGAMKVLEGKLLEKDFEYTLVGSIENAGALFNVDFFERTSISTAKFLGETGEYNLYYNPARKNVILEAPNPSYPDYLTISGVGLAYPGAGNSAATIDNWNFSSAVEYILMRKMSDNVYQATVTIPHSKKYWWDGGPYYAFKVYENTDFNGEMGASSFTGGITGNASDIIADILDAPEDNNMDGYVQRPAVAVRITIDKSSNSMSINSYALP